MSIQDTFRRIFNPGAAVDAAPKSIPMPEPLAVLSDVELKVPVSVVEAPPADVLKYTFNFEKARKQFFPNGYTPEQTDSISAIVRECNEQQVPLKEQVAYILATAYHECHNPKKPEMRMTPMREFGGDAYLKSKKYYPYYGRGFSQLTWKDNYAKEGDRLNLPLVQDPDMILDIDTSANSHVYCMMKGRYTGRKVPDYINENKVDYVNARRVVNGTDKADLIAGYAEGFEGCL